MYILALMAVSGQSRPMQMQLLLTRHLHAFALLISLGRGGCHQTGHSRGLHFCEVIRLLLL